jgi:hypothetical protein
MSTASTRSSAIWPCSASESSPWRSRPTAVGRARSDALYSIANAYRDYANTHPGRAAAALRAPAPDDPEHVAVSEAVAAVLFAVLDGYGIAGEDAIDAIRSLRAAMHGFVSLEAAGGFGLPRSVQDTYARLIGALDIAFATWARQ